MKADRVEGNIKWRKTSKPNFRDSIKHCAGVIANGGFELSSECLQLGKKVLIKPLKGQYEQLSNMLTLEKLGLCSSMMELDHQAVHAWLAKPNQDPILYPSDPNLFIDWLLEEDWDDTDSICKALWQQVRFPRQVEQRLVNLASV